MLGATETKKLQVIEFSFLNVLKNSRGENILDDDYETPNGFVTASEGISRPVHAAVGVTFTDLDLDAGDISGDVIIEKASDENNIVSYVLYWGSASDAKLDGQAAIASIAKTGDNPTHTFPENTRIPSGASHLLVFTENAYGEMKTGIGALIEDKTAPIHAAVGVTFTDTDPSGGRLGGDASIDKASDESDLTHYVLYWGTDAATKVDGQAAIASIAKTGDNLIHTFSAATFVSPGTTYLLVFTKNDDGEMKTGVSALIVDDGVPVHAAEGVTFIDVDPDGREIAGDASIDRASDESDLTHYVLYWGTDAGARLGDPISSIPKTGGNLTHAFSENTEIPEGAARLLVFTKKDDGEMATGVGVVIADKGVPVHAAAGATLTDTDIDKGQLAGDATIDKASDESDLTHYVLYWGTDAGARVGEPIVAIPKTGDNLIHTFAADTSIPGEAARLLVFTKNDDGEMGTGVSVIIVDKAAPAHAAGGVSFSDIDMDDGDIAGDASIDRASDESDLTHYVFYWGTGVDARLGDPIAVILKTGDNLLHTFSENTEIPEGATHFLVFAKNDDGEASTGVNVLITDKGSYTKLTASDASIDDNFGQSVSISGDYAIAGAYYNDESGDRSGSAYIFKIETDGTWSETAKLTASDASAGDQFGVSVFISGDYAVVGAHQDDDKGADSGSAYVFKRNADETWSEKDKLIAADGEAGDWFGESVSISGDYIVAGAYYDDDNGSNSGSVYVFKRNADETWSEKDKLTASDGEAIDQFGISVSISGDYLIAGANYDDDAVGSNSGAAYVFKRNADETWSKKDKLTALDTEAGDLFGESVSISGDYAVVGSHYDDDAGGASGSAYVFKRNADETWTQTAKLTAIDAVTGDQFGYSVSISGDYVVAGAYRESDSGAIYVFKRNADETWEERAKVTAYDTDYNDYLGCSVSVDGDHAVAGGNGDDDSGSNSGAAYVFKGILGY